MENVKIYIANDKYRYIREGKDGFMEMAAAIPVKYDYVIFDACLMGGIEVAYELKDKARVLFLIALYVASRAFIWVRTSSGAVVFIPPTS